MFDGLAVRIEFCPAVLLVCDALMVTLGVVVGGGGVTGRLTHVTVIQLEFIGVPPVVAFHNWTRNCLLPALALE